MLAQYGNHLTYPFLAMTEASTHKDLLVRLPKLHSDLVDGKATSLEQFKTQKMKDNADTTVPHISTTSNRILVIALKDCATVLYRQRKEYFGNSERGTNLETLSDSMQCRLATDNIRCERALATFDRTARRMHGGNNISALQITSISTFEIILR